MFKQLAAIIAVTSLRQIEVVVSGATRTGKKRIVPGRQICVRPASVRHRMRPLRWLIAAVAVIRTLGWATQAAAQMPSFELEGLIAGDEAARVWYSARGFMEADTGNTGAAFHYFRAASACVWMDLKQIATS